MPPTYTLAEVLIFLADDPQLGFKFGLWEDHLRITRRENVIALENTKTGESQPYCPAAEGNEWFACNFLGVDMTSRDTK